MFTNLAIKRGATLYVNPYYPMNILLYPIVIGFINHHSTTGNY